ncbi:MAG: fibrobacter succinogenes major paralogous domain-containing protein [Dysgonamonadaceae bacterium]|jgi:uncharacterized protein (TIGR02145 family)|nr:fibrobacter succinogenes major paralogous domain-containing protein [Dysgonamonadaceae bacterium]
MKMTKKTIFLLLLFLMVLGTVNVNAQVRIGGSTAPHESAILDLNFDSGTDTLGLLLPRVHLIDVNSPTPLRSHIDGLVVYNLSTGGSLNKGIYYSDGAKWHPVLSSAPAGSLELPIIFLRQPGFLWLGSEGELTDTLFFELADVDKSQFTYQWYIRDAETLVSTRLEGDAAKNDTLFINPSIKDEYGIISAGKVYQFYCVVFSGSQYSISGTGHVVYGSGARLANNGWIKIANANLGAEQNMTVEEQINYEPDATKSEVNDKDYDPTVYGDWYQWGRKKDGHENRKVLAAGTSSAYRNAPKGVLNHPDSLDLSNGQIVAGNTLVHKKFIQRNAGTNDWRQYPETDDNFAVSPANDWTWGNPVKGITDLDPCKTAGPSELGDGNWRVPTQAEWLQIQSNNTWVLRSNGIKGYEIKPGGANKPTSLFLPAAGYRFRDGGKKDNVNNFVFYWSSTTTNTTDSYCIFNNNASAPTNRSNGLSVRCVSEY